MIKKNCVVCGKEFETQNKNAKYCSHKCTGIGQRKNKMTTCAYCGKEFYKAISQTQPYNKSFCCKEHYYLSCRQEDEIFYENDYAYILLTKNGVTKKVLFDVSDVDKIKQYKWHLHYREKDKRYDACTNKPGTHKNKKRYISMHRFLLNYDGNLQIDHINRNTLDNRSLNLRIVTPYENNQNKESKFEVKGITFDKSRNKWKASIQYNGIVYDLGRFDELRDAIMRRKIAERTIVKNANNM